MNHELLIAVRLVTVIAAACLVQAGILQKRERIRRRAYLEQWRRLDYGHISFGTILFDSLGLAQRGEIYLVITFITIARWLEHALVLSAFLLVDHSEWTIS